MDDVVDAFAAEDESEGERALEKIDEVKRLLDPLADDVEAVFETASDRDEARTDAVETVDDTIDLLAEVRELVSVGDESYVGGWKEAQAALAAVRDAAATDDIRAALRTDLRRDERSALSEARSAVGFVERECRNAERSLEGDMPVEARIGLTAAEKGSRTRSPTWTRSELASGRRTPRRGARSGAGRGGISARSEGVIKSVPTP